MSSSLTKEIIKTLKSLKGVEEFKPINKEMDSVIKFLMKNDLEKKLPLFEKLIYSFKAVPKIYFLSILLQIAPNHKYFNNMLKILLGSNNLSANTKFFVLYQCVSISFTNKNVSDGQTRKLMRDVYQDVYESFKSKLASQLNFIPKQDRDKKLIFIFTAQFLNQIHAPTKTALDRAYCLRKLGYETIIINTTEFMSQAGAIPFNNVISPNIIGEHKNVNSFEYLDEKIPYFQCSANTPNIEEIQLILNIIGQYKPYFAFSIGTYNVVADICSNVIPVGNMSTVFSSLPATFSQFHITGKTITKDDIDFVSQYGFSEDNLISNRFTFAFKKQSKKFSRKDFDLPEDRFVITFIGGRLTQEMDGDLIQNVLKTVELGAYLLFVGQFDTYDDMCKRYDTLEENSAYVGMQDDVLAVLELCDLYINPKRVGGGSSAVEALYKDVPVITYNFGDVYTNVGDDFAVKDDDEFLDTIKMYISDKTYYKNQQEKAKQKCKELMDSKESMRVLIEKVVNSPLFT